jgi:hypothetical protein
VGGGEEKESEQDGGENRRFQWASLMKIKVDGINRVIADLRMVFIR